MRRKDLWLTAGALLAIIGVSILAYRHETRPVAGVCQICQRPIHGGTEFRLDTGKRVEQACCPRCGMHFQISSPGMVRRAWATDLASGRMIPAELASYVEGGDVAYCTMHESSVQREPQGVAVREFDRCLPTLVAFKTRDEAIAYQNQHGGRVLDYAVALESVKVR